MATPPLCPQVQNYNEVIRYILVKAKLPPNSMGRIVHIPYPLISQVRQPPNISGCQVCNPPLIKSNQWGGGPSSGHKGAHGRISTSESTTQVSISSPRKDNSLIKELYGRVPKRLQRKIKSKTPQKSVITFGQEWCFSLAKRTDLHLVKCLEQRSHNKCCNIVLWAEVVTIWQEPACLSSLYKISNCTYK